MTRRRRWIFLAVLAAVSLVGMLALWRSTPYGLGLVNDSATYVEGATSILAGKGYVRVSGGGELKPITHFPPLFSILLAGLGLLGMDFLQGARVLITILFGVDILLVGLSVYKISQSMVFAYLGALLLAVSDLHLGVFSFALSEPLFITLMLAGFLCLAESFDHPHWIWQVMTGVILSLAYLTRFAGASLFLTAVLVITLLRPSKILKRIGLMLAGAIPPMLAWLANTLIQGGTRALGNRQLLWHPPPIKTLFEAIKNLLTWIAPNDLLAAGSIWGRMLSLFSILILPALIVWLIWVVWHRYSLGKRRGEPEGDFALAFTQGLHLLVYLGFLVVSLTFFDASTPLNDRILSVIYVPELILFSSGLAWLWLRSSGRMVIYRWGIAIFSVLLVAFSVKDGYAAVQQLGDEGQGFTHRGISGSPAIQVIRELPPTVIYTNKPGAIFLLTGKSAYVAPTPMDPVTSQVRSTYKDDLVTMQQRVRNGEAILVLFGLRNSQDPDDVDLFADLSTGLHLLVDYGEIVIFGSSP
jgi:hypothetical protein